jgi:uncharacterized SAM-binding protein YcdF (DUF218 family)
MKRRSQKTFYKNRIKSQVGFLGKFSHSFAVFRKYSYSLVLLSIGFTFGALMLAFLLAGDIYDYKDTAQRDSLPQVDAIVCLAGGRGRILAAGELWYQYLDRVLEASAETESSIPILYFSGLGHQATWSLLTRQLSRRVLQVVQPEDVIIENESANTDENAKWLLKIAQERNWKRIVLLTSSYHMKRANYIFARVLKAGGLSVQIDTLSVTQEPFSSKQWRSGFWGIRVTLLEYLKWIYYKSVWTSKHPE